MADPIRCPTCPMCGSPPQATFEGQAFGCSSDGCPVIAWDTTEDRESLLRQITVINL